MSAPASIELLTGLDYLTYLLGARCEEESEGDEQKKKPTRRERLASKPPMGTTRKVLCDQLTRIADSLDVQNGLFIQREQTRKKDMEQTTALVKEAFESLGIVKKIFSSTQAST